MILLGRLTLASVWPWGGSGGSGGHEGVEVGVLRVWVDDLQTRQEVAAAVTALHQRVRPARQNLDRGREGRSERVVVGEWPLCIPFSLQSPCLLPNLPNYS